MKKINLIILILVGLITVISCEKDETKVMLTEAGIAPALTAPTGGTTYVLTEENDTNTLTTFTWSLADFGYDAAIDYTVQFDFAGNDFATPNTLGTTTNLEFKITVGDMNQKLLLADGVFGTVNSIETRVLAIIKNFSKTDVDTLASATVALDITPYEVIIVYPTIYVPGNFQAASGYGSDWSPDNELVARMYSVKSNNKYEGYVYMANGSNEFKFTDGPNWDLNWGDTGADGTLDEGGDNILAANPGFYKINVDLNTFTYTPILDTDWGLIGDATPGGWDTDTDMTYNVVSGVWELTVDLVAGNIKFRANDDWGLNYGSDNANGICDAGGTDIPVATAGNYTITLDLGGPLYRYTVVKN